MRVTGSDSLLLTYLNTTDTEYDLSEILKAKGTDQTGETVTEEEKSTYNSIKASAVTVQSDISPLLSTEEDSLFAEAEKSGNNVEILSKLGTFVEDYNKMVKEMTGTKDNSNDTYLAELKEYFEDSAEAFEAIGITRNSDGTLAYETGKLEAATTEELKAACQGNSFLTQVSEKCDYIGANAAVDVYLANAANYTAGGAYANTQTETSSMLAELYNTVGSYFDSKS